MSIDLHTHAKPRANGDVLSTHQFRGFVGFYDDDDDYGMELLRNNRWHRHNSGNALTSLDPNQNHKHGMVP